MLSYHTLLSQLPKQPIPILYYVASSIALGISPSIIYK